MCGKPIPHSLSPAYHFIQVACCPVYGGTNGAIRSIISKLGVEVTWVKADSVEEFRKNVKSNTKVEGRVRET